MSLLATTGEPSNGSLSKERYKVCKMTFRKVTQFSETKIRGNDFYQ